MGELRDNEQFRDIELTEDTILRAWRQIPSGQTVIEILETEPPENDGGVIARLFLDDTGRQQLVAALTADLPENVEPCPVCEDEGGPIIVENGGNQGHYSHCPECGK